MSTATNWLAAGLVLSLIVIANLGLRLKFANEHNGDCKVVFEQEIERVENNAKVKADILTRNNERFLTIIGWMSDALVDADVDIAEQQEYLEKRFEEKFGKPPANSTKKKQPAKDKG